MGQATLSQVLGSQAESASASPIDYDSKFRVPVVPLLASESRRLIDFKTRSSRNYTSIPPNPPPALFHYVLSPLSLILRGQAPLGHRPLMAR